ncbi:MAG: hypothetical protein QW232_06995 [Saccharolobus sp.]
MKKSGIEVKRDVSSSENLILLEENVFSKIFHNEMYLKVIANPDYKLAKMSKSYYYYILNKLRKIDLLSDNKLNFTIVIAFSCDKFTIKLKPLMAFLDKRKKLLYIINIREKCYIEDEILKEFTTLNSINRNTNCKKIIENLYNTILNSLTNGVIHVKTERK